jgi:2-C-methyl-D-erythritol 4-phosphate cytidylyltransferase
LVVHRDEFDATQQLLQRYEITEYQIVTGGKERQDSVLHGLEALSEAIEYVLIHDAARPFISSDLIECVIHGAREHDAVIPAIPVKDTIKVVETTGVVRYTPDRKSLWAVQTPQAFRLATLKYAIAECEKMGYVGTDDASLLEKIGLPVYIVNGEETNIKITTPNDLIFGEVILRILEERR